MGEVIRRSIVLKEYDIKETPDGKQKIFSIKFITKKGELIFIPNAVACGLPYSLKENRQRGVVAIDSKGDRIGHPYPVDIDLIVEWNGKKVAL